MKSRVFKHAIVFILPLLFCVNTSFAMIGNKTGVTTIQGTIEGFDEQGAFKKPQKNKLLEESEEPSQEKPSQTQTEPSHKTKTCWENFKENCCCGNEEEYKQDK